MLVRNWHERALCKDHPDPDLWHYETSDFQDERLLAAYRSIEAIEICNECPVKAECLKQGLEPDNLTATDSFGSIWGGLMRGERLKLLRLDPKSRAFRYDFNHIRRVKALRAGKIIL